LSEEGRQATEEHRRRQLAIRAAVLRDVTGVWRTEFDIEDVASSQLRVVEALKDVLADGKLRAAEEAADYYSQFRAIDGPGARRARPMGDLDGRRVDRSVGYSARIVPLKALKAGRTRQQAARAGLEQTMGASGRLVSDGSRETVIRAAEEDPAQPRWQRITGPEPCEFCAMLSARGGVYRAQATAVFEAHSGRGAACQCEAEPVYGERFLSEQQQRFKELYDREAKGTSDPLKAFRAAYRREIKPAA